MSEENLKKLLLLLLLAVTFLLGRNSKKTDLDPINRKIEIQSNKIDELLNLNYDFKNEADSISQLSDVEQLDWWRSRTGFKEVE